MPPPPSEFEKYRVLVLDQSLTPMSLVSWQNGIRLVFRGSCKVLANYGGLSIRSATKSHAFPAVISYTTSHRPKFKEIKFDRRAIFLRDCGGCAYCGLLLVPSTLTIDHVIPISKGGAKRSFLNCVACCACCNQQKKNRTPEEAGMKLLKQPFIPKRLPFINKKLFEGAVPNEWLDFI